MFDSVPVDMAAMFGEQGLTVMSVQSKDEFNPNRQQGERPQQARTRAGLYKWKVQVMGVEQRRTAAGEAFGKGDTFTVGIAMPEGVNLRELLTAGKRIEFTGVRFGGYERRGSDDKKSGGYGLYWAADGIATVDGKPLPTLAGATAVTAN